MADDPVEQSPTTTDTTEAPTSNETPPVHEVMSEAFHGGKFYDKETQALDTGRLGDSYTALLQDNLKRTEDIRGELQAEALKNRPGEASEYVFQPEEGLMPEGVEHKWDDNDPTLDYFREMAHRRGLSREDFNADVNQFIRDQSKRHMDNSLAQSKSEMSKLGERGVARVEAIESWATSNLSEPSADALVGGLKDSLGNLHVSSAIVEALEEVMNIGKSDMTLPKDDIPASSTREQYEAEARALMRSPEYIRGDQDVHSKVAKRFEVLYPPKKK